MQNLVRLLLTRCAYLSRHKFIKIYAFYWANLIILFLFFHSFVTTVLHKKWKSFCGIRTQIVSVNGGHADN